MIPGMCISFGTGFGVIMGEGVFGHLGIGLPIGMGLGLAIGSMIEKNAKKRRKNHLI